MSHVLCIPVSCECRGRAVWIVDIHWLAAEGVAVNYCARGPLESKALRLPRGAIDVTGRFTVRCPRCLTRLHVLPLIRARLAAGVGLILEAPLDRETALPEKQPRPDPPRLVGKGARLLGCDGRRAPRAPAPPDLRARASISFNLTVVDINVLGMLAGHTHEVQLKAASINDLDKYSEL